MLSSKIHNENVFHHELASRQAFLSNSTIIEVANRLYLDRETHRPKRGAQALNRAGALYRFVDVVQQLDLKYDLCRTSAESLIQLLPEEFEEWQDPSDYPIGARPDVWPRFTAGLPFLPLGCLAEVRSKENGYITTPETPLEWAFLLL